MAFKVMVWPEQVARTGPTTGHIQVRATFLTNPEQRVTYGVDVVAADTKASIATKISDETIAQGANLSTPMTVVTGEILCMDFAVL